MHVADGVIEKELLIEIFNAYIVCDFDNEQIKLKIYEAISPLGSDS